MGHRGLSWEPITGEGHRHLSLMGGESHVGISVGGEKRGGGRQVEGGGWRAWVWKHCGGRGREAGGGHRCGTTGGQTSPRPLKKNAVRNEYTCKVYGEWRSLPREFADEDYEAHEEEAE
ncbi:hypothetical protein E2C01_026970 [Portunus trituberculatus]|uniref:Uncharacterized protein n=1 Tax=Portunus trituberculatus TaxID=210409 RepID=A0A5B7EJN4_PORTR|nr:hypothetical protein [Portunus trituberculatus]